LLALSGQDIILLHRLPPHIYRQLPLKEKCAHNNLFSRVVPELEKDIEGGCKNIKKISNIRIFFFKKGVLRPSTFPSDSSTAIVPVIYTQAYGLKIHWATEHKSLNGAAYELITADTCSYNSRPVN